MLTLWHPAIWGGTQSAIVTHRYIGAAQEYHYTPNHIHVI